MTTMAVQQIEDGADLLPNRIHVMPPGKDLTSDGLTFRLAPLSTVSGLPNGFDIFLRFHSEAYERPSSNNYSFGDGQRWECSSRRAQA